MGEIFKRVSSPVGPLGLFLDHWFLLHMAATCGEVLMSQSLLVQTLEADGWSLYAGVSHLFVFKVSVRFPFF